MWRRDAVALFLSLSGENTARIVRRRVEKSEIKWRGFNWKKATIYIMANEHLVEGMDKEVKKFFPIRKSNKGTKPGMASEGMNNKERSEEKQWYWYRKDPGEKILKKMIGMISQIAIRVLWENYCYNFGGRTYQQSEGGPIGQRPTMAASRLVMEEYFEIYSKILTGAGAKITLLKVYVDDGRQVSTVLKKGMRFEEKKMEFVWNKEAEEEDIMKEKQGENKDSFMARLCLPAMNAINPDLTFTVEVPSDFKDERLPTLDFSLWMSGDGQLRHSYFEKEMKTQKMIEKDSAMSTKQKITILSNELTRRLYNIDDKDDDMKDEVEKTIENMTRQLKNSGWERREVREIVVSGTRGWIRRSERRIEESGERYRSAAGSLKTRA